MFLESLKKIKDYIFLHKEFKNKLTRKCPSTMTLKIELQLVDNNKILPNSLKLHGLRRVDGV